VSATPAPVDVDNPADDSLVRSVEDGSLEPVAAKARVLRDAQPERDALEPKGSARWLFELQTWLLDRAFGSSRRRARSAPSWLPPKEKIR